MRGLALLAAALLVGAFALATAWPVDMPLSAFLALLDDAGAASLQAALRRDLPAWAWSSLAVPLLTRPAWLGLATLGLIAAGAAVTMANSSAPRSRRSRG